MEIFFVNKKIEFFLKLRKLGIRKTFFIASCIKPFKSFSVTVRISFQIIGGNFFTFSNYGSDI